MILALTEYRPAEFGREAIPRDLGRTLYERFGDKVEVEEPSFRTGDKWRLTSQGWVGYIPLSPSLGVSLKPKVPIGNLFRMLEYAYDLKSFELLEGLFDAKSLEEFYERLASGLAKRVLDRGRKGFSRTYEPESERLSYVRGRLDVRRAVSAPWDARTLCHYHEHTADTEDNRILAWTLYVIARSGLCSERVMPNVRHAYRQLANLVTTEPQSARLCVGRLYTRLNEDYRPMHALCRFFLENSGPSHNVGDRTMLPFLVNMARLFEQFVAEWIDQHLPPSFGVKAQESIAISEKSGLAFNVDLVVRERESGRALAVLDTKYKAPTSPSTADVAQVIAYAKAVGCFDAILVYPTPLHVPLDEYIGDIRVRTAVFDVVGNLDLAGYALLDCLLA